MQFIQAQNRTIDELENLQQAVSTVLRSIERERQRADANHQPPEESRTVREFIAASQPPLRQQLEERLMLLIGRLNIELRDQQSPTRPSTERDREAVRAINQAGGDRENAQSSNISKLAVLVQTYPRSYRVLDHRESSRSKRGTAQVTSGVDANDWCCSILVLNTVLLNAPTI